MEAASCPSGSSKMSSAAGCQCSFGFSGQLRWERGRYQGSCLRTPCPSGTLAGTFAGECFCQPPDVGHVVWRRVREQGGDDAANAATATFEGTCTALPCPSGSSRASDWTQNGVTRPRCRCGTGKVGGFVWQPNIKQFSGRCVSANPCAPGNVGAQMVPVGRHGPDDGNETMDDVISDTVQMVGKCDRVVCPQHAATDPESGLCRCQPPYNGSRIEWSHAKLVYLGQCIPDFHCPRHATYRNVDVSIIETRLACVCRAGYAGGHMTWDAWGNRVWHGTCKRVPCPLNGRRGRDGVCHCTKGSVRWDALLSEYAGHCDNVTESTIQAPQLTSHKPPARAPMLNPGRHRRSANSSTQSTTSQRPSVSTTVQEMVRRVHRSATLTASPKPSTSSATGISAAKVAPRNRLFLQKVPTKGPSLFLHAFWHPIKTSAEPIFSFLQELADLWRAHALVGAIAVFALLACCVGTRLAAQQGKARQSEGVS